MFIATLLRVISSRRSGLIGTNMPSGRSSDKLLQAFGALITTARPEDVNSLSRLRSALDSCHRALREKTGRDESTKSKTIAFG